MKKIMLLFLIIVASFALFACKGGISVMLSERVVYFEKKLFRGVGKEFLVQLMLVEENGESSFTLEVHPIFVGVDTQNIRYCYGEQCGSIKRGTDGKYRAVFPYKELRDRVLITTGTRNEDTVILEETVPAPEAKELMLAAEQHFPEKLTAERTGKMKIKIKILAEDNFPSYYYVGFWGENYFAMLVDPFTLEVVTDYSEN